MSAETKGSNAKDSTASTDSSDRTQRDLDTRDHEMRPKSWAPPSVLPTPENGGGYRYRWIRTSMLGESDNRNVSKRLREGWVPVRREDFPELQVVSDHGSEWGKRGNLEVGGLLLCKIPEEIAAQRDEYFARLAAGQQEAVDQQFMGQSDERMPVLSPERSTKVSFGQGSREA